MRLLRLSKVVNYSKDLRRLTLTMYLSLPSVINIGMLLLLIMSMFAILGMQTCGNTHFGDVSGWLHPWYCAGALAACVLMLWRTDGCRSRH